MEIGIIGIALSGKTTVFNLLTASSAETGFAAGKKKTNLGMSKVPDPRLDRLSEIWSPKKTTYTTIKYVDVAGVQKGTSKEGFSPELIGCLKNTDALLIVLRAFDNDQAPHPEGSVDPVRDLEILWSEMLFSDLMIIENRIKRIAKQAKGKDEKALKQELELMERCQAALEDEKCLRELDFNEHELLTLRGFQFLTQKPLIIALNINEADLEKGDELTGAIQQKRGGPTVVTTFMCAPIEQEISELPDEDAKAFMEDLGLDQSASDRIRRSSYELMNLISFFTMGEDECRAWTIEKGTKAPQAAGAIHSDLERGFIRAEVVHYDDFIDAGSTAVCREKGLLRLEGKDYIVKDGDILNIRFSV